MTPEEIITELNSHNREVLFGMDDFYHLTPEQVLQLMDAAALRGFRLGSNVAVSMVQGALLVQLSRIVSAKPDIAGV